MYVALQTLPGGSTVAPFKAGQGTVYLTSNVPYGAPVVGSGLWLMGANDPHFANHPPVWLSAVSGGIFIKGISSAQQLTGWKIGIDSTGSRILNGGSSSIELDN